MSFSRFAGRKDAKLALILNLIDPGIGGVLFLGDKGTGKSTLARSSRCLFPEGMPFVEVPLNVTEDALMGSVDMEKAVKTGERVAQPGLVSRARGGVLYADDINLLNPDIVNLMLNNRDGGSDPEAPNGAGFSLAASMNPEEGPISSKLIDHFGLCAVFETSTDTGRKKRVLKRFGPDGPDKSRFLRVDEKLKKRIARARKMLSRVEVPTGIRSRAVEACLAAAIEGHRGDIAVERAARAFAAFCRSSVVLEKHLEKVLPLALIHRRREAAPHPEEEVRERESESPENRDRESRPDSADAGREDREESSVSGPVETETSPRFREERSREEVFPVGESFKVRRIDFRRDRIERRASGRRTNTRFMGKGGRYVKSVLRSRERDVAVDATLRAAAPWQIKRGRTENVIVSDDDLRFKRREKKMGHLVVFVVDCSGSMGAKKRMVETKGAVLSLLVDCYHKRDKVSLIAFRKDRAEIVLPPTASVELASKKLREVAVGGKTPLPAALAATYDLIGRVRIKEPHLRFVVVIVSDGRANQSISGMPVPEEVARCASMLRQSPNTDFIVVDTEEKSGFLRADLARRLAADLHADYFTAQDLKAEHLAGIVAGRKI